MSSRLQVREPLGPLVTARPAPLPELDHYPGGRFGPYLTTAFGVLLGMYGPGLLLELGVALPAYALLPPVLLALLLPPHVIPWSRRLSMRRQPTWDGVGDPPAGVARVTGVVRAVDDAFVVPGTSGAVVYARTRYPQMGSDGGSTPRGREDVRGVRFQIVLPTGASVHLDPRDVCLLGGDTVVPEVGTSVRWALGAPWAGPSRPQLFRSTLTPGDRVEAVGELALEVNIEGAAAPGRGVPMVHLMKPVWKGGVWVRKLG